MGGRGICGTSIAGLKDYTTIYDKKLIIFQNDHGYKKIQQLLKSLFEMWIEHKCLKQFVMCELVCKIHILFVS